MQGAPKAAPLLLGHEDEALRRLRGNAAPAEAGCSGSEVLAWALEGDRWLQDSRVRYTPSECAAHAHMYAVTSWTYRLGPCHALCCSSIALAPIATVTHSCPVSARMAGELTR